jgi:hypothetical protein
VIELRNTGLITVLTALMLFTLSVTVQAAEPAETWSHNMSSYGSSYTTILDGKLEFILMDGWTLARTGGGEYIIAKEIDGEIKEIGGIEVLGKEKNNSPNKIFTSLRDSGGNYILIEDLLLEKQNHSQYRIKWIKDKKYYNDIYVIGNGASSYHITLMSELEYFERAYQQFEDFLATINIREQTESAGCKVYYNNTDKYTVCLPEGWQVDNSREFAGTAFTEPGIGKLYIYKQPLNGRSPDVYIRYSNKKISEGTALMEELFKKDGRQEDGSRVVEYMWRRPKIKTIEQDFNYYYEMHVIPQGENYVYTFMIKTDNKNMEKALADFHFIHNSLTNVDYNITALTEKKVPADESMEVLLEGNKTGLSIPGNKTLWGIFSEHVPGNYLYHLKKAEANLGHRFDFVMTYSSFDTEFPKKDAREIYADGRIMMLTLHPWSEGNTEKIMIPGIVSGDYDDYIKRWANEVKELGEPVFFRFANEMNGDWDPWCAWFYGKDQDLFTEAWKRVYNLFEEAGADNAYFVWNPHDRSFPDFNWNNPHLYYPGDEYVDWIGLTGYNNGVSHDGDKWRDFDTIYKDIYYEYLTLYPDKPFMITEFASNEAGGDKAVWIRDAFNKLAYGYPRIKVAVWFNQVDGRWEYPIDSSIEAKLAFKNGLKLKRFDMEAIKK